MVQVACMIPRGGILVPLDVPKVPNRRAPPELRTGSMEEVEVIYVGVQNPAQIRNLRHDKFLPNP